MSDTLTLVEINCTTGEVIERPLTQDELTQHEIDVAATLARKTEEQVEATRITNLKTSAKAKLVAGEPLTEEEAATIVL
jgi:hypothetical protein